MKRNKNFWSYRLHKLGTPKVLGTDGRTDGRSGPITRPAFAKATQVKIKLEKLYIIQANTRYKGGALWLSGRVLDLGSRGCRFKPHRRHCVVSLSKTLYLLLSTGSTQEDRSRHD